jgi:hypothetical protein
VVHDGTGTASKTDHYTGGKTMRRKDQSQINTKSMGRDAAIQIIGNRKVINTASVVLRGMEPAKGGVSEFLFPVLFTALSVAFLY